PEAQQSESPLSFSAAYTGGTTHCQYRQLPLQWSGVGSAMKGSLSSLNVPDLIVDLYFTRRTGILRLNQGEIRKSIYFKDGSVVFAHSNLKQERLGEVLLRLGKITEEEFNSVAGELEEGKRLGSVLHEKGFLSQSEITMGVGYQLQQIIYSVFNWDSGEYEFVDRDRPVYEDIMVDVSTPNIV